MRVSDAMTARQLLSDLQKTQFDIFQRTREVSSGKKLSLPSQDPPGATRTLRIRDQLSRTNQYERNINQARVLVATTQESLNTLRNLVDTVFEKVSFGINGTNSQTERDIIAEELNETLASMVRISQLSVDGRRLFSGSQVDQNPLDDSSGTFVYVGDQEVLEIEIAEGRSVRSNIPGSEIFTEPGSDLVNTVSEIRDALQAGDVDLALVLLDKMEGATDAIDRGRVKIAVALGQLETTKVELDQTALALTQELASVEDADLAESITGLNQSEAALRSILSVGVRSNRPILFDLIA